MYGWRLRQIEEDSSEAWLPMLNLPYFLPNRRFTPALDKALAGKAKYEPFLKTFDNFYWGMKWQCAKEGRGTVGKILSNVELLTLKKVFLKKFFTQFLTFKSGKC